MILDEATWQAREQAHARRAHGLTAGRLERRARGEKHPVEDFLFEYYPFRPAQLARWHPGCGIGLAGARERAGWKDYVLDADDVAWVDAAAFIARRGRFVADVRELLEATAGRAPHLACFGMHEWAMVYRAPETRHDLPLRLGAAGTDAVLESVGPRCTHFDAFRFFTPDGVPLNGARLTRASQPAMEQPGCLHAGMDLYKWAAMLGPLVPGELLLDCFEHARDVRVLDMEASPYDVRSLGYGVVPVETPEGRAEYVRRQRSLAERSAGLRGELVALLRRISPDGANRGGTAPATEVTASPPAADSTLSSRRGR